MLSCSFLCAHVTDAVWGWLAQDDELILFCNPPLGLPPAPTRVLIVSNNCISCVVVIVYAAIIIFVKVKGDSEAFHANHMIVRRLQIILLVFICSWFATTFGTNILRVFGLSEHTMTICLSNFVSLQSSERFA
ncbi:hypothetical protein GCK32_019283 [Trichostrongylus colubriformis]|uniref:Uncharacterized protein n=1 Tax=Trichostrongylus colubriformis TaxID=6319 RepID=A0AAN8G4C9_TRICO